MKQHKNAILYKQFSKTSIASSWHKFSEVTYNKLHNNKGETLIESMSSMLLYTILLMIIIMIIKTSLTFTDKYTTEINQNQEIINEIILDDYKDLEIESFTIVEE